jgi:hypothetical protein
VEAIDLKPSAISYIGDPLEKANFEKAIHFHSPQHVGANFKN